MLKIDCADKHFSEIGRLIRQTDEKIIVVDNALGHRYIASGAKDKEIIVNGTPGNAMGAYLDGCKITVNGSAQDF